MIKKLTITGSVGINGLNKPNDIQAVQTALNQLLNLIPPTKKLAVDGRLGPRPENSKTVAAIKMFQNKVVNIMRPDGRIDVNGKTQKKINERLLRPGSPLPAESTPSLSWMITAKREIGQAEVAGKRANPKILEYFKASKYWGTSSSRSDVSNMNIAEKYV